MRDTEQPANDDAVTVKTVALFIQQELSSLALELENADLPHTVEIREATLDLKFVLPHRVAHSANRVHLLTSGSGETFPDQEIHTLSLTLAVSPGSDAWAGVDASSRRFLPREATQEPEAQEDD